MAISKATKKFERGHLKDALKRRKESAKVKQRYQTQAKHKSKHAADRAEEKANYHGNQPLSKTGEKRDDALQNMSVDDFFAQDLDISAASPKAGANGVKRSGKRKRIANGDDPDDSSVASVEDHASLDESDVEKEGGELDDHKRQLKKLAKTDPEFYKMLQEEDADLLDPESAPLDEVDQLSDAEGEEQSKKGKKGKVANEVTKAVVKKWAVALQERHSLRQMREVVLAFRAAAHLDEDTGKEYKYDISDAEAYHDLLTLALKQVPAVLKHHIPVKELPNGRIKLSTDSKKFRTLTLLLKSHATSVLHLLDNLSDKSTTQVTLNSILDLLPYLLSFRKLIRDLIRSVVEIWSDTAQTEATRVTGFLVLRRLTMISDPGIKESVLKTVYQGLIKSVRSTTIHNIAGHNLMKNSAAELWGLADGNVSYTTAFTFIRQLAIHLRNSIKNNANEAYKAVYNWQYVHSLDFWSRVLSAHCEVVREATSGKQSPLRPLIYPLTQVTLGAMRLIPTSAYFPLRFHTVRSLIRLSRATNTFIPLTAPLYEVLTSAEMRKAPKPSTLKPLDFETSIRASKSLLHTRVYQDGIGEQLVELLGEFFLIWCKSIAFPELALPVILMLKRWLKEVSPYGGKQVNGKAKAGRNGKKVDNSAGGNKNGKVNGAISLIVQKLDANSKWVEERRAKVEYAPNNRAGVEGFLKDVEWTKTPLGAFVEGQRKLREEKRKLLEEGRREDERKKAKERKARADEMDMEMQHGGVVEKEVEEDESEPEDDGDGEEQDDASDEEMEIELEGNADDDDDDDEEMIEFDEDGEEVGG